MEFSKVSLVLTSLMVLVMVLVFPSSYAQDSPQDFLNAHNTARAAVGVGLMAWDEDVATYARDYANQRSGDCQLIHSDSGGVYGGNLAWGTPDLSGTDAVEMWVNEMTDYDYATNTCTQGKDCGHYTQVVWRDSVLLGCAKVKCANDAGTFISCNYSPPGNIVNEKPY